MNVEHLITQMAHQAETIRCLTQGVSVEQARWRPAPDAWSILEVMNHLYDEEREDFRARLDHVLRGAAPPWPSIDPQGWVTERAYNQRDLDQSTNNFLQEREASLVWLKGLDTPDWQRAYAAPFGSITAGDLFMSWVMHDLLHIRQLVELHGAYTVDLAQPYQTRYAGEW